MLPTTQWVPIHFIRYKHIQDTNTYNTIPDLFIKEFVSYIYWQVTIPITNKITNFVS